MACARLGISLQPARPYMPTDKSPVERWFRTLREGLLAGLPGYKGLCVPEIPGLEMSPLEMYEHGVQRAGHLRILGRKAIALVMLVGSALMVTPVANAVISDCNNDNMCLWGNNDYQ